MDFAPLYGGIVFAISNTFSNLSGFLAPLSTGALLGDDSESNSIKQWQLAFWVTALINIPGIIAFQIFGTETVQEWAKPASQSPELDGKNSNDDGQKSVTDFSQKWNSEVALCKCELLIDFFSTYLKNMAKSPVIQSKVIRIILLFLYTSNQWGSHASTEIGYCVRTFVQYSLHLHSAMAAAPASRLCSRNSPGIFSMKFFFTRKIITSELKMQKWKWNEFNILKIKTKTESGIE